MPKLAHVNIRSSDLDASVAFYRDVLGLTPGSAETRPDSVDHVWMSDEEANPCIHLQRANGSPANESETAGLHHIALSCAGLDHWRAKLKTMDVEYRETEFCSADIVQLNLRDPDGVRVELLFRAGT
jgi:catechol 2,3-dioxygenase-like lactoylglutathione lyase family enzyme